MALLNKSRLRWGPLTGILSVAPPINIILIRYFPPSFQQAQLHKTIPATLNRLRILQPSPFQQLRSSPTESHSRPAAWAPRTSTTEHVSRFPLLGMCAFESLRAQLYSYIKGFRTLQESAHALDYS